MVSTVGHEQQCDQPSIWPWLLRGVVEKVKRGHPGPRAELEAAAASAASEAHKVIALVANTTKKQDTCTPEPQRRRFARALVCV